MVSLVALLGLGLTWFFWAFSSALDAGWPLRAVSAIGAAASLPVLWHFESRLLARRFRLNLVDAAGKIAVSWLPLAVLPLSAPYFDHRVYSSFLSGSPSFARIIALALWLLGLAFAASVTLKILLFWPRGQALLAAIDRGAPKLLWAGVVVYLLVFFVLVFLAYSWYKGYHSDLGQYNQTLWATLRGRLFYSSLEETSSASFLSTHVPPFLLALLPVYALHQSPLTFLILRSLALGLAAVPLFYCARRLTGSGAASLLLAAAFLFHPEIVAQHFTSGYEVVFVAVFFFAAFYFFQKKSFWPFLLFFLLMLSVREDFVLAGALFGVYALIKRRPLIWVVVPMAVGLLWQAAVFAIMGAHTEHWVFNLYYGHFGDSPGQMAKTVLRHPVYALEEVRRLHFSYLYNLMMPAGLLLPLTSLASIFAIPNLSLSLARGQDFSAAAGGISHYSVLVVAAFWLGLAGFAARLRRRAGALAPVFLAVVIAVLVAGSAHLWWYYLPTGAPADGAALTEAVNMVPPAASVASNDGRALVRLSSRWEVYEPLLWDVPQPPDFLPQGTEQLKAEYVLLKPFRKSGIYNDEGAFGFLYEQGNEQRNPYRLIFERDGIRLYKRDRP